MLDFLMISTRSPKRGAVEVYPKFLIKKSKDLMIRGGDFYAVWDESANIWSLDEHSAIQMIDKELDKYAEAHSKDFEGSVRIFHLWDSSSGMIDNWHKYCQKQLRDSFHTLDEKLVFSNMETTKKDYVSRRLPYPLAAGPTDSYNSLMSTLYSPEERHKIEWAIGSIVSGESVKVQKFLVLYGSAGTGKSTVLNIIQQLFEGYYSVFDAKALGSTNNSFALEAFKSNPLIAIQHDGDLSKIGDNTRLNSLVSHELMTVNEKFKSTYASKFKCFLFMGTNKPVKITDAKSGIIRRLIDVSPTGNVLSNREYKKAVNGVDFELGAIAQHCQDVYLHDPGAYDSYIPTTMLGASNDFYNYIEDAYFIFQEEEGITLKAAWERYKTYCTDANVQYPFSQRAFKEELRNYFVEYKDRHTLADGTRVRSYFVTFKTDKFEAKPEEEKPKDNGLIQFNGEVSEMDILCSNCPAQYASEKGNPILKWDNAKTVLADLDSSRLHYVKVPDNHIVIDFDMTDGSGNKSLELNLQAASKWPKTYTEVSKSGGGVHLHYIYNGDVTKLARIYEEHIEIKVFAGKSSLRRKLTLFNDSIVHTISSGLPLKGGEKMINFTAVKNEKAIRTLLHKNLNKDCHPGTKPSIDFIFKILEDAHKSGMNYDVSDMKNVIMAFGANSTNQSDACIELVSKMHFKSENISDDIVPMDSEGKLIFYDVEVFPNLFVVCWKKQGSSETIQMINPTPAQIEELLRFKLVGFNCRRYDNHILYGRLIGYGEKQLYDLSQAIINGDKRSNAFFGEAWNLSYTDVYDFSATKQSLKKFEIELGIHHQELGLPWDQPVPKELWPKVAEYCVNDVVATEAVFEYKEADFTARKILAEVAGMSVNSSTNSLSTKIIFGTNKAPQDAFNYRDMGEEHVGDVTTIDEYSRFNREGNPIFPGYEYTLGKSWYRGEEVGEGGYVYSEPGMYGNVALLDIASMHPRSLIVEQLLGPKYTKRFSEIVEARLAIKHGDIAKAKTLLEGALIPYLDDPSLLKDLSFALKIVINSVYGLTSAKFPNAFKDPRNIDNLVAKRGSLFMINLKHAVQERGFTVAHIKTDSIKIPDATPDIIEFVMHYGEQYGYTFEHEATYDRICLVNNAVYIARYKDSPEWTATGTQFKVPYVYKTLFSKENIEFDDLCETKSVQSALYLDYNEKLPDVIALEKEANSIWKKLLSDKPVPNNEVELMEARLEDLKDLISEGHNYKFIGKVGRFCPVVDGANGGILLRSKNTSAPGTSEYASATGAKDHRWLESEMVTTLHKEKTIDRKFYDNLVDEALETMGKFGDVEWFMSEEPYSAQ